MPISVNAEPAIPASLRLVPPNLLLTAHVQLACPTAPAAPPPLRAILATKASTLLPSQVQPQPAVPFVQSAAARSALVPVNAPVALAHYLLLPCKEPPQPPALLIVLLVTLKRIIRARRIPLVLPDSSLPSALPS